ncbi:DNA helicase II / ATP-dependent DNA helicase PcrA [Rhizoctonia solani]|uniref:DNA 3'-5' helicase n=1 Tax=Rhizoctonia solani TaxID=456999 RepID=A0A0K6GIH1_9AGAM|nr:DNA helicase II / ATP-dependent DNA helicase PcrA [Rhizoctonia solani]
MLRHLEINLMRRHPITSARRFLSTQNHLEGLNGPQRQAVEFPPNTSLQILAGPGTGKTRVLTSRVAELILSHKYSPSSICAVTFTRRAAREMRSRLHGYIGAGPTEQLKLGTFHSVCANYLRTYGLMVNIEPKFLIWDDEECALLIKYIARSLHKEFEKNFPAAEMYEMFSTVKERAKTNPTKGIKNIIQEELKNMMEIESAGSKHGNPLYDLKLIIRLFSAYSQVLRDCKALDFTDLLIKGLDLFRAVPWAQEVTRLRHVLVDEFQDTSSLQYLIVKELFKATEESISVVGDPDQSIYGWRGADNTVFDQMKNDLPQTKEIYLEENYRSTAANIAAAINIISQDKTRPAKTLFTSRVPDGPKPVKKGFSIPIEENTFIVDALNRLLVKSDGLINYGDCAILFRTNHSAAAFSKKLREAGIPNRQLPELTLNDRDEVKNLLAFLRLAINDAHTPMLIRAMTGPLGAQDGVITDLVHRSIEHNITLFNVLERLQSGLDPDTNPSSRHPATLLIQVLTRLRALMEEGASPVELLRYVIGAINYHQYLMKRGLKEFSWRNRSVEETMKYARNFKSGKGPSILSVIAFLDFMRDLSRVNDLNTGKVTLLTCHSAKGLEWPVVFIPDVVDGVYPHMRSDYVDEERRLLYVACTRAKCLLYITHSENKLVGSGDEMIELARYESEFIKDMPSSCYQDKMPSLGKGALDLFGRILGQAEKADD